MFKINEDTPISAMTINKINDEIDKLNLVKQYINLSSFHKHIYSHSDNIIFDSFCYICENGESFWFVLMRDNLILYNILYEIKFNIY